MTICSRKAAVERAVAGILAMAFLAGCSLEGTGQPPVIEMPTAWSEPAGQNASRPDVEWWKEFGTPELASLMQDALLQNADLAAAKARVRQADALLKVAGASLLPTLGGSLDASRQGSPKLPGIQTAKQGNLYSPMLAASYEVDFWGKNAAVEASATAEAEAARYAQRTVALTVQSAVASSYFSILGLKERLAVARENLADAERTLEAYRERMAIGAATRLDVAQQESEVAVQRAGIPPL